VLKEFLFTGVPRFFEAFFGDITGLEVTAEAVFEKCKKGNSPYYEKRGWPLRLG
jgi:hypothetical protein